LCYISLILLGTFCAEISQRPPENMIENFISINAMACHQLLWHDQRWPFDGRTMERYALRFDRENRGPVQLPDYVPEAAARLYFEAATRGCGNVTVTGETVFYLQELADRWDVPKLRRKCAQFLAEGDGDSYLVPGLKYTLEHNETAVIPDREAAVRAAFPRLANRNSGMFDLELPAIGHVLNFGQSREDFDAVFCFLIDFLAEKGPSASVLFATLDVDRLSIDQLAELRDSANLIQTFVIKGVYRRLWKLLDDRNRALALARSLSVILDPHRGSAPNL
jgi:hypothetical protein